MEQGSHFEFLYLYRFLCRYPIFLYHGKNDNVISYESSIFAESKLKEYGFDVTCKIQDQLDHGIDENGLIEGKKFLSKILGI